MEMKKESLFGRPTAAERSSAPRSSIEDQVRRYLTDVLIGRTSNVKIKDFGQLRQCFKDAHLEDQFRSWMTRRSNLDITPEQLRAALKDTNLIESLKARIDPNIDDEYVVNSLLILLPNFVREVTPFGDDDPEEVRVHLQGMRKRLSKEA